MFEFDVDIKAKHLMTRNVLGIQDSTSVKETKKWLEDKGFDIAPVFKNGKNIYDNGQKIQHPGVLDGKTKGFVVLNELRDTEGSNKTVGEIAENITINDIINSDASIDEVLKALDSRPWYFIGSRNKIRGVLTRADLNKPPVYVYFYIRIYELIVYLRNLIRKQNIDWQKTLAKRDITPNNFNYTTFLKEINEHHRESERRDLRLPKIEFLSLTHIREIVKDNDKIKEKLNITPDELHEIKELRNDIAHPKSNIDDPVSKQKYKNIITYTERSPPFSTGKNERDVNDLKTINYNIKSCIGKK